MGITCRAVHVVFVFLLIGLTNTQENTADGEDRKCKGSCCQCYTLNCTCPAGYMHVTEKNVTTADFTCMDATNTTSLTAIDCVKCDPNQYFNADSVECSNCDTACRNCIGPGPSADNCTCKHEFMGNCYEACPNGTVAVADTAKCENKTADKTKDFPLPIIIGSSAGGGVLVVIVVIVVVVCCCRRSSSRQMKRKSLSTLSQERNEIPAENQQRTEMGVTPSRNYENTPTLSPKADFSVRVMQQADKVTRYTPDPTSSLERKNQPSDDDSPDEAYGNFQMIQLHKKNLTSGPTDKLNRALEEVELQELGQAPVIPGLEPVVSRHPAVPRSTKKTSVVKRLSQRVVRKFISKKDKPKAVADGELYLDMSNTEVVQEMYVEPSDLEQEVYQNEELVKKVEASASKRRDKNGSETDLEDYENADSFRRTKRKGSETEQEDYENTDAYKKSDHALEDYENVKDKVKPPSVPAKPENVKDKVKPPSVPAKPPSVPAKPQSVPVRGQNDEDNLEDYENAQLFKVASDMPYENVTFKKK